MKKMLIFPKFSGEVKKRGLFKAEDKERADEDSILQNEWLLEQVKKILDSYKLNYENITCDGFHVDLRSVSTTNKFYRSFLSVEQLILLDFLEKLSYHGGLEYVIFEDGIDFELRGEYYGAEVNLGYEFLKRYGDKEDAYQFAFPILLEKEMDNELREKLNDMVESLALEKAKELSEIISNKFAEIRKEIYECIKKEKMKLKRGNAPI